MAVKSRLLPFHLGPWFSTYEEWKRTFPVYPETVGILYEHTGPIRNKGKLRTILGNQVTDSEGHPFKSHKGFSEDIGGNFFTQKREVVGGLANNGPLTAVSGMPTQGTYGVEKYFGPVWPHALIGVSGSVFDFPSAINSSNNQLNALGATAVSISKPTNSAANIGTMLGELAREGLPSLPLAAWQKTTDLAKQAGKEYLGIEFGWKPIAQDMSKFLNGVARAGEILDQLERDAGRLVRRRFEFPSQKSTSVENFSASQYPEVGTQANQFWTTGPPMVITRVRETERRQWFSGAFTYYLPSDYDSRKEMARYSLLAKQVYGVSLTPELIWELAPWSWAVDWFSNLGDVISNASDIAGHRLVMRYGYMMEYSSVTDTYTRNSPPEGRGTSLTLRTVTKVRRRANPFGFGVDWNSLSPFQLSIAAALGISRR